MSSLWHVMLEEDWEEFGSTGQTENKKYDSHGWVRYEKFVL